MTKKAEFVYRVRLIREHSAKLQKLITPGRDNAPAWEVAAEMATEAETRLAMLIQRIHNHEI